MATQIDSGITAQISVLRVRSETSPGSEANQGTLWAMSPNWILARSTRLENSLDLSTFAALDYLGLAKSLRKRVKANSRILKVPSGAHSEKFSIRIVGIWNRLNIYKVVRCACNLSIGTIWGGGGAAPVPE